MNTFSDIIAKRLTLRENQVGATLSLRAEGCTIPFISRYRKERTGGLDEVQIGEIFLQAERLEALAKRKETVCATISEAGKMTDELQRRIDGCWDSSELEDIYLPFKPRRRTKAQMAREQGLEPLATTLLMQREQHIRRVAERFVRGDVKDVEAALKGAQDLIAETVSEDSRARQQVRGVFRRGAVIVSKVVKAKADSEEAAKYSDYFDFSEPLRRCSSHRLLAMRRGEAEGILRISITTDETECIDKLHRIFVRWGGGECCRLVEEAVDDGYKRLLQPSIENEFAAASKQKADEEAIAVFAENLRQLLLAAPLGQHRVMGIDPGFRTGCKVVCLDEQGSLLHHEVIAPHPPRNERSRAAQQVAAMVRRYAVEAIAIGNGTASRETLSFVKSLDLGDSVRIFTVSEDGASVYSASETAREEFPDEDVTVRGAVSIGRRLMDPLAELVKIDPKSIGVGQYQHDVNQAQLRASLDRTVESCVNAVGVNLNTASRHLLTYVSGLNATTARNIVEYRRENGPFASRAQLKKVPRIGPAAFQQCAGFLRIRNAKNPLDGSAVHPESYAVVEAMAKDCGLSVASLIGNRQALAAIDLSRYVTPAVGMPTLTDIRRELEKPGLDPRSEVEDFEFDSSVQTVADLREGMVLPGIVTNITNFGAFVDVGVHQDGLVHISQLADRYVEDPAAVVRLHQHVRVKVLAIDTKRNRISLTLKGV